MAERAVGVPAEEASQLTEQFCEITSCSPELAQDWLKRNKWQLEVRFKKSVGHDEISKI